MEIASHKTLAFLFVGVTCGLFQSKLQLQGSSHCRWYENPELPEIVALQERYASQTSAPTWYGGTLAQATPQNITVTELLKFDDPHNIFNNKYVVNVKIKSIASNIPWWYMACQLCNCTSIPKDRQYKCIDARCICTDAALKYRLVLLAAETTTEISDENVPTIELVFFGPRAEAIIGVPINALVTSNAKNEMSVPQRIKALYGKHFRLRISVSKTSLRQQNISYKVDGIEPLTPLTTQQTETVQEQSAITHQVTDVHGKNPQATPPTSSTLDSQETQLTKNKTTATASISSTHDKQAGESSLSTMVTDASLPTESTDISNQQTPPPGQEHATGQKRKREDIGSTCTETETGDSTAPMSCRTKRKLHFDNPPSQEATQDASLGEQ